MRGETWEMQIWSFPLNASCLWKVYPSLDNYIWHYFLLVSSLHLTERMPSQLRSEVTLRTLLTFILFIFLPDRVSFLNGLLFHLFGFCFILFKAIEKSVVPWVNDQDVPFCPDCGNKFSIRNRRHHCRLCGSIMCKKCMELISLPLASR